MAKTTYTTSSKTIVTYPPTPTEASKPVASVAIDYIIKNQATRLEKSIDYIEKTEGFPPAEIVSLTDFNRIYEESAEGEITKNEYGSYYDALESVHSITNEDVSYVVEKSLSNDVTGEWASLRSRVESDIEDSVNMIEFMSTYYSAIRKAEKSLDFCSKDNEEIQAYAEKYLNSKLKSYETKPENRLFLAEYILSKKFDSNSEALKSMLEILKNNLTKENNSSYLSIIDSLSLKIIKDLNVTYDHWYALDSLGDNIEDRMSASSEIISHVLSLSTGIQRFNSSNLSSKDSVNRGDYGSIFEGTNLKARPGKTIGPDPVPYLKKIDKNQSLAALALIQYENSDGELVLPVEQENSPDGYTYFSGKSALIRKSILSGDFSFSEFKEYQSIFENTRSNIDQYLELFLGQCDPSNPITPFEIFKIICDNFKLSLDTTGTYSTLRYRYTLLYLLKLASESSGQKQNIVRALQIVRTSLEDVGVNTTETFTTTTKSSDGETIDEKADVKTTETTITKRRKIPRVIEKISSDTDLAELEASILVFLKDKLSAITFALDLDFEPTVFTYILKAYEQIVSLATTRLPEGSSMVNGIGTTLYSNFEEFSFLVLVVECFVNLSSTLGLKPDSSGAGAVVDETVGISLDEARSSLENFLNQLQTSELDTIEVDNSFITKIKSTFKKFSGKQRIYQDSLAYLAGFSDGIKRSSSNIVKISSEIIENSVIGTEINTPEGRETLANLSRQQVSCKRSFLENYYPIATTGYLPAKTTYSVVESKVLEVLLSSPEFSKVTSENFRIVACAAPVLSIDNEIERFDTSTVAELLKTGMLEIFVFRKDHEFDDLVFKPKKFLIDPLLYAGPRSFDLLRLEDVIVSEETDDVVLEICKKSIFSIHDLEGTQYLTYDQIFSNVRYRDLEQEEIREVLKNTMLSYLMGQYIFKLSGAIFDENLGVEVDSSVSKSGLSAISTASSLKLSDLVLPTPEQINMMIDDDGEIDPLIPVDGTTIGDREIIASLANSYLIRNDKLNDRITRKNNFDRIFLVVIDPDDFEIDADETINRNGLVGRSMLNQLDEQGLFRDILKTRLISRDPASGGFSIGNLSCQFSPHPSPPPSTADYSPIDA